MAFGIHQLEDRNWTFKKNVTVNGNFTFGDASTDNLNCDGNLDVAGTATFHEGIKVSSAKNVEGVGTRTNGILLKNLKNYISATTATITTGAGTAIIEVNLGGTAYYFNAWETAVGLST